MTRRDHRVRNLAAAPALVDADGVQLQQVLLNLIINAADAQATCLPVRRCLSIRSDCQAGDRIW